jgi:hypothetical protein
MDDLSGLLRFTVAVLRAHQTSYGCWVGRSDSCRGSLFDEQTARTMMPEPSSTSAIPINTDNLPEEAYGYASGREHQYSQCPAQCHAVVTQSWGIQEAPQNSCIIGSSR